MKAPLSWLKEYVPIEMDVEKLASRLALTGTEVERVSEAGVPGDEENLRHFVVGKVLECGRHPDADKLSVCTVDVGEERPRTIVCGAPNVAAGQTVAVVLPGGAMPDGTRIRDTKLRGVSSAGMILSEAELGLAAKSPGTMELPDDWTAGELLIDRFAISDRVLEVEVTPNRPDCLSIRGLAREIAAITGAPFEEQIVFPHPVGERSVEEDIVIEVRDPDLCPRYAGRVIQGVTIADSPLWMKARISHAGMRPISNVVDVTNYVLWSLGQPLHAFDLQTIRGGRIIVRRAYPGEELTTLDNERRVLSDDMLVIADAERASVVAGVMGGLDSEITENTTDILLEGANFWGPSIMRTEGALGLRSEASTRYEKGLDPEMIPPALDMACKLFVELCGGTVSSGTVDVRSEPLPQRVVRLRPSRVAQVLGAEIARPEIARILTRLGCAVGDVGETFSVSVPTFRGDLEREIDLIEEIARVHGLDSIPSTLPARRSGRGGLTETQARLRLIEDQLAGAGLSQVITYSFGDERWPDRLRLDSDDRRRVGVRISNPLSADQSVMRTLLLPGLLATAQSNVAVREDRVHIFEFGRVYHPSGNVLPDEDTYAGILVTGDWEGDSWLRCETSVDYYLVKGLVERVCRVLHCPLEYKPAQEPFLHPGRSAVVRTTDGRTAGWLGEIHPLVLQEYDLRGPAAAAELDVSVLLDASSGIRTFKDLLAYPVVEQDLALVVDKAVPAAAVMTCLQRAGGELLEDVAVFDLYEGNQVPAGKKSLALRLSFRAPDRTLSDAEVNELREAMLRRIGEELGAGLRA
ncbi:MAG: phenylalanine--tRNA ligase subunit beta [Thermoleophilia bacterium]|nr:phenylalanine--tRNA ligase subunit beta [Thermoleophilia bacterium]